MTKCKLCKNDAIPVVYKPVGMRADGTIELNGPLCKACAAPPPSTTGANFVKGGGSASDYRPPSGPKVVSNSY